MKSIPWIVAGCALLACCVPAAAAEFELRQDPDVALEHQRMPGNARAQAERRGAIRSVPHLFVYHPDARRSPAFHMSGLRPGFERQLDLVLNDFRVQRSMVALERLLERAVDADGQRLTVEELPARRIVLVLYHAGDCGECRELERALDAWTRKRQHEPVRIRIEMPD